MNKEILRIFFIFHFLVAMSSNYCDILTTYSGLQLLLLVVDVLMMYILDLIFVERLYPREMYWITIIIIVGRYLQGNGITSKSSVFFCL